MFTPIVITAAARASAANSPARTARRAFASFPGSAVAKSAAKSLDTLWLHVLAWHMRRMNRTILYALDDRALHDIGLHRSGIEAAVRDIDAELARRKRVVLRRAGHDRLAADSGRSPLIQTVRGV